MDDLNLIPQSLKIKQESKFKKIKIIVFITIFALILVVLACIPIFLTLSIQSQNVSIIKDIGALSSVNDEINKLNEQKKIIQDRINVVDSISKQDMKWLSQIGTLSSLTPPEIKVSSMNTAADLITLQCSAPAVQPIAAFVASLENSGKFLDIKLPDINPDEKTQIYTFSISFKIKPIESKVN